MSSTQDQRTAWAHAWEARIQRRGWDFWRLGMAATAGGIITNVDEVMEGTEDIEAVELSEEGWCRASAVTADLGHIGTIAFLEADARRAWAHAHEFIIMHHKPMYGVHIRIEDVGQKLLYRTGVFQNYPHALLNVLLAAPYTADALESHATQQK